MDRESRTPLAALLLAALLLALATARLAPAPSARCAPREAAAVEGRSVSVTCRSAAVSDRPLRGPARLLFDLPVDPNRAGALTLEALPGIGPVRAGAIVRERASRAFERVEELIRVPGIGPKTLEKISPYLAIAPDDG